MVNDEVVNTTSPAGFRLRWDVFLSFRGEDTRHGITQSLYSCLLENGIRVFRDDDGLDRGDQIAPSLLEAIEDSAASIVILSRDYASSHWCLEELARICELKRLILPVFYEVDPSHVRKQKGSFEKAFCGHEKRFGIDKVKIWRNALETVGGIAGWVFTENSTDEKQLIRVVVRKVLKEVNNTPFKVATYVVGLDERVTELINMLDVKSNGVKMLGLHGMGGIGKTTLAKAVFNKILPHFQFRSFVSNVRDLSRQEDGLVFLQNKLMADLSITNSNNVDDIDVNANASKIRKFVNEKNVLLVLDDVDEVSQLHALGATISKWQSDGRSQIIVTTRSRGVLGEHYIKYEVMELHFEQAVELFSYHALPKPTEEFMKLSKQIVTLTGNLPLAVEVFGSFLWDKRKVSEWEDALKKLEGIRPQELQDVLKISFDGLDMENQCIFLDIACLFVNMRMKREDMIDILKGCDFKAEIALRVLEEKSLIKFTAGDDTLTMHDQIRDMGRQIVQNENFADPGMRSRLWDRDEIISVLKNHKGTRRIEGIVMDIMKKEPESKKEVVINSKPFESMVNLRLLQINNVKLEGKLQFLPHELKWLQWQGCPLKTLPPFCPQKLAVLDLSDSKKLEHMWRTYKVVAENLMVLNLSGCSKLAALPDLSGHGKLQKLVLTYCVGLINIHESVGSLKSLSHLNLTGCKNLTELPSDVQGMKNLQTLILNDCLELKKLPESIGSMRSLKELYANSTSIENLPESIYHLEKLEKLSLRDCRRIKQLPKCVGKLFSLKELHLDGSALEQLSDAIGDLENLEILSLIYCESLTQLPDTIGSLKLLKRLLIKGSAIIELPNSIGSLFYLKYLFVGGRQLSKLPDSIQGLASIVELGIDRTSITDLPCQIGALRLLRKLEIISCTCLKSLPESIGSLLALTSLNIFDANITELPESFGMLENLITLRLNGCKRLCRLPSSIGNLKSLHHFYMPETAVTQLPESFGMLSNLMVLKMRKKVKSKSFSVLPASFSNLSSLEEFDANAWSICGEISDDFEKLSALEILNLGKNDFSKLPSSLRGLSLLKKLLLPKCQELKSLPPLPSSLEELNLADCISLEHISDLSSLNSLELLNLTNCEKLEDIPGLECLTSMKRLYLTNCSTCSLAAKKRLSKVYLKNLRSLSLPGSGIPDWFSQDSVRFSSHKSLDFKGVIIAVVVSLNHQIADELRNELPAIVDIQAKIFDGDHKQIFATVLDLTGVPKTKEDQVYLLRYPELYPIVSMLKDGFEIQVTMRNPPYEGVELKKAGIYLVFENDDDYQGDEESLDDSQQSVSQKLAKFFGSLEEDDHQTYESNQEMKNGIMRQFQIEEERLLPGRRNCYYNFVIKFIFLFGIPLLVSWLCLRLWYTKTQYQ